MITRENYRQYDAVNYSKLSALDSHPKKVNEDKDFSDGIRNGSILDTLVFDGQEKFDEEYFVSTVSKLPSDAVKAIIEACEEYDDDSLLEKAREFNYGNNWKDATVVKKVKEDGEEYIHQLELSRGKTVIDYELYVSMIQAVNTLKESPKTKALFTGAEYQSPVCEELNSVDGEPILFKGLRDIFIEESEQNIVADLKYMSSGLKYFHLDFIKWRYDLQSSLYSDLTTKSNGKPTDYYIVVFSSVDNDVMKFKISPHTISCGRWGGYTSNGRWYKGYIELTKELLWHIENDLWNLPYEYYFKEIELNPYSELTDNGSIIAQR